MVDFGEKADYTGNSMNNLTEQSVFTPEVLVPETGDGVTVSSVSPALQSLANRTRWLKNNSLTSVQAYEAIEGSNGLPTRRRSTVRFDGCTASDVDGKTVVIGMQGPQGFTGAQGYQGVQGFQGEVGPGGDGAAGVIGPRGYQGNPGVSGNATNSYVKVNTFNRPILKFLGPDVYSEDDPANDATKVTIGGIWTTQYDSDDAQYQPPNQDVTTDTTLHFWAGNVSGGAKPWNFVNSANGTFHLTAANGIEFQPNSNSSQHYGATMTAPYCYHELSGLFSIQDSWNTETVAACDLWQYSHRIWVKCYTTGCYAGNEVLVFGISSTGYSMKTRLGYHSAYGGVSVALEQTFAGATAISGNSAGIYCTTFMMEFLDMFTCDVWGFTDSTWMPLSTHEYNANMMYIGRMSLSPAGPLAMHAFVDTFSFFAGMEQTSARGVAVSGIQRIGVQTRQRLTIPAI
jgi:hypothetical protein